MKLNVSEEIICKCQNHGSRVKQMSPKPYIKRYKQQRDEKLWLTLHQILKKKENTVAVRLNLLQGFPSELSFVVAMLFILL